MLGKDCFVSPSIEEREVTMLDGAKQKLWFCKVSSYDWERFLECLRSNDPDQRALKAHVLVAASLCDPDGNPALTLDKAKTLNPKVAAALFVEALAVNKQQDAAPGNA